jgi:plastocyanin
MPLMPAPMMPRWIILPLLVAMLALLSVPIASLGQAPTGADLPPVAIDAVGGYRWSTDRVIAAPGQRLVVTNRDVQRHTFVIDEWAVDTGLPAFVPVEVAVPDDAEIGSVAVFYSSAGNDRELGLEGVIRVVTRDEILADADQGLRAAATLRDRLVIEVDDDFTFTPSTLDVEPGAFIEIRNPGVIEHHFVVDEWDVNETIPSGDIALVQVPDDLPSGAVFTFYCSVPGHSAQGMSGTLTILPARTSVETVPREAIGLLPVGKDLRPFVPDAAFLGPEWTTVRSGTAGTLIDTDLVALADVFPQDGLGAVYVGPQGSRITLVVLQMTQDLLPANQVEEAIDSVQGGMVGSWDKDRIASAAFFDAAPPTGCDTARRVIGIVPVLTIPAGATACQLRSAGVTIFVTVEGGVGDVSGVDASDSVVRLVLGQSTP